MNEDRKNSIRINNFNRNRKRNHSELLLIRQHNQQSSFYPFNFSLNNSSNLTSLTSSSSSSSSSITNHTQNQSQSQPQASSSSSSSSNTQMRKFSSNYYHNNTNPSNLNTLKTSSNPELIWPGLRDQTNNSNNQIVHHHNHNRDDSDDEGPALKKRRGVASTIISTAIDAALFTSAVGYAAYQFWLGKGPKEEIEHPFPTFNSGSTSSNTRRPLSKSATVLRSSPPPPYQVKDPNKVNHHQDQDDDHHTQTLQLSTQNISINGSSSSSLTNQIRLTKSHQSFQKHPNLGSSKYNQKLSILKRSSSSNNNSNLRSKRSSSLTKNFHSSSSSSFSLSSSSLNFRTPVRNSFRNGPSNQVPDSYKTMKNKMRDEFIKRTIREEEEEEEIRPKINYDDYLRRSDDEEMVGLDEEYHKEARGGVGKEEDEDVDDEEMKKFKDQIRGLIRSGKEALAFKPSSISIDEEEMEEDELKNNSNNNSSSTYNKKGEDPRSFSSSSFSSSASIMMMMVLSRKTLVNDDGSEIESDHHQIGRRISKRQSISEDRKNFEELLGRSEGENHDDEGGLINVEDDVKILKSALDQAERSTKKNWWKR